MSILRRMTAVRLPIVMVAMLTGSAVTMTMMPVETFAAGKSRGKVPSKNAKPKKGILKKAQYTRAQVAKNHVRSTVARENAKLRADAAARRKSKRLDQRIIAGLKRLFGLAPKRTVQRRTNTGKRVTVNAFTMVKFIPADNNGRKVPKRS